MSRERIRRRVWRPMLPLLVAAIGCTAAHVPARRAAPTGAAISTVRVNVINMVSSAVPFRFTFGEQAPLDTVVQGGMLRLPLIRHSYSVTRGTYYFTMRDGRTGRTLRDSLQMGVEREIDFATIEVIFEEDSSAITVCHCVRLYGEVVDRPSW